jgi:putative endonuclease
MLEKGLKYEEKALDYLLKQGLTLETKNFRCKLGEIDIVMKDGDCIVFVEVRYRQSARHGNAAESITYHKQKKICKAAALYLTTNQAWHYNVRYDAITIEPRHNNLDSLTINWIKSAFEHTGYL